MEFVAIIRPVATKSLRHLQHQLLLLLHRLSISRHSPTTFPLTPATRSHLLFHLLCRVRRHGKSITMQHLHLAICHMHHLRWLLKPLLRLAFPGSCGLDLVWSSANFLRWFKVS